MSRLTYGAAGSSPPPRTPLTGWVVALLVACSGSTPAGSARIEPADAAGRSELAARQHSDATLAAVRQAAGIPGIAAAIYQDDRLAWEGYVGLADTETGEPLTREVRFRVGSVSKVVTAVALARLWQRGAIDLDADVRRYVPGFPRHDGVVTARLLAGHLGGIRNYQPRDFDVTGIDRRHFATTSEALEIFAGDPLVAPPGTQYHYSTLGYTLLAAAMEGATGKDFLALLAEEVFTPLGLHDTGADEPGVRRRAGNYERTAAGKAERAEALDLSYKWAGEVSTPRPGTWVGWGPRCWTRSS